MSRVAEAGWDARSPAANWIAARAKTIDGEVYKRHERQIFVGDQEFDRSSAWFAVFVGIAVFVALTTVVGPVVKEQDNGLLMVLFSFFAVGAGIVGFAAVPFLMGLFDRRDRVKNPNRQVWSSGTLLPLATAARQAGVVASVIAEDMRKSPAWAYVASDSVRGAIDLDATVVDVLNRSSRIDAALASLSTSSDSSSSVAQAISEHMRAAAVAFDTLVDRVRGLAELAEKLRPIEDLIEKKAQAELDLKTLDHISNVDPSTFDALYRDAGMNEWHTADTRERANDLTDIQAALEAQVVALREIGASRSFGPDR